MFGTTSPPLPPSFAPEHRPLRLTGDAHQPVPTGSCHFVLLHPSVQNQRCSCQCFQHSRNASNVCDCGHQACYHVPQPKSPQHQSEHSPRATEHDLLEKIHRLEETIKQERETREAAFQRERAAWEREVRILREGLAPFYRSEQDMRRKLIEIEDRIEGNYDEQLRLRDKVVALDDAGMALERRVEASESYREKRRKISRSIVLEDTMLDGQIFEGLRRRSSNLDERSNPSSSRALSPNSATASAPELEEARSSGILNLINMPRSWPRTAPTKQLPLQPKPRLIANNGSVSLQEEPRSSGFLALDLAERNVTSGAPANSLHPPGASLSRGLQSPANYPSSDLAASLQQDNPKLPPIIANAPSHLKGRLSSPETFPRKRKYTTDRMALDVLAEVSVASPLVR